MREHEVPQEDNATLGGHRKAVYALDEAGRYQLVASTGWEVEETVTLQAVAEYEAQAVEALRRARIGEASPLEYHMYRRRMDLQTLAQSAGVFAWRLRRHLRPGVFRRLRPSLLVRYADALGLSVDEIQTLPAEHQ